VNGMEVDRQDEGQAYIHCKPARKRALDSWSIFCLQRDIASNSCCIRVGSEKSNHEALIDRRSDCGSGFRMAEGF